MDRGARVRIGITAGLAATSYPEYEDDLPAGVTQRRTRLTEIADPVRFDDTDCARELAAVADLQAQLDAYQLAVVARMSQLRPDLWELTPDHPGAGVDGWSPTRTLVGVSEFFVDEIALLLRITRARAETLAHTALALTRQLTATWAALADSRIDLPRAQAIAKVLGWQPEVDPEVIAAVEREALEWAVGGENWFQLQQRTAALLLQHDAAAADRRRKEAQRHTDVKLRNQRDGMAELVVDQTAEVAAACRDVCDTYARMLKDDGDRRPIGQLRALVAADLILRPWDVSRPSVTAHLTVLAPLPSLRRPTALGTGAPHGQHAAPSPGSRDARATGGGNRGGHGTTARQGAATDSRCTAGDDACDAAGAVDGQPITAAHLRELLDELDALCPGGLQAPAGGSVDIGLTDPETGELRAVVTRDQLRRLARRGCLDHPPADPPDPPGTSPPCDCAALDRPPPTTSYRPTPAQQRYVAARDRTCRHPGCSRPARWTDADHVVSHHHGGTTDCANLCCLCRRHHRLKTHAPGWRHVMSPDGTLTVTTPTGVRRTTRPPGLRHRIPPGDLLVPIAESGGAPVGAPPPDDDPPPF